MGQDPDAIRREIEDTRDRMGDTLDAIGYKADVPSRAKENVQEKVESVKSTVRERLGGAGSRVGESTPDREQVKQGAKRAAGVVQENPLGLAVGAVAVGFLAGMVVPESRKEHEKLGPVADRVKEQAAETGREAVERGRQVAQSAAQSAADTAREEGRQHGQDLSQSAREGAERVGEDVRSNPSS